MACRTNRMILWLFSEILFLTNVGKYLCHSLSPVRVLWEVLHVGITFLSHHCASSTSAPGNSDAIHLSFAN